MQTAAAAHQFPANAFRRNGYISFFPLRNTYFAEISFLAGVPLKIFLPFASSFFSLMVPRDIAAALLSRSLVDPLINQGLDSLLIFENEEIFAEEEKEGETAKTEICRNIRTSSVNLAIDPVIFEVQLKIDKVRTTFYLAGLIW